MDVDMDMEVLAKNIIREADGEASKSAHSLEKTNPKIESSERLYINQ